MYFGKEENEAENGGLDRGDVKFESVEVEGERAGGGV